MARKKEAQETIRDIMELTPDEQQGVEQLQIRKSALRMIQESLVPTANLIAADERQWWDKVLGSRGISRLEPFRIANDFKRIEKI